MNIDNEHKLLRPHFKANYKYKPLYGVFLELKEHDLVALKLSAFQNHGSKPEKWDPVEATFRRHAGGME